MPEKHAEKMDLASFLMGCNALIAGGAVFLYVYKGCNEYISPYAFYLALVLAAQNFFFLLAARRRPDPFILIMTAYSLFFYELRVATLLWDPWSIVFVRNIFTSSDLELGLLYVILSNVAIFLGVSAASGKFSVEALPRESGKDRLRLLLPGLLMAAGLLFESRLQLPAAMKGYLGIFLNTEMFLLFFLIVIALYHKTMTGAHKMLVSGAVLLFVVCRTAAGSRSAIVTLLVSFLAAWFAVNGRVLLRRKLYFSLAIIAPLAVGAFLLATYLRAPKVPVQLQPVFNRLGFLDMTSEVIAGRMKYRDAVNFHQYMKSVVDNALTPGFTVFDAPKAANLLSLIYYGIPDMSLKTVSTHYQSDMMTVYAESYLLFGPIAGLLAIFVGALLFRTIYGLRVGSDPFRSAAVRTIVLTVFYTYFLGSFGIDWFIVDLARGIIPFCLIFYFFAVYVRRVPAGERYDV